MENKNTQLTELSRFTDLLTKKITALNYAFTPLKKLEETMSSTFVSPLQYIQ